MKDTEHDIKENNEVLNDDASIASFVDDAVKPVPFEEENNLDEKATSEEEFDCSSVTVSSEGERKIAALDEKSRRLKAQFAEENRLAIESMDKIREEIKQSQEREDAITNDLDEMRKRQDEIKQDLRGLDEMSKRREREEEKWKAKIDHKKKNIAKRLEKLRADRSEYQRETEAANEKPENQDQSAVQCKNGAGHQMEHECKDAAKTTSSCLKEDTSNIILYQPHEVKEYSSVKQLEKKRKELRLEKMEKKAIEREKMEQRERRKIEKDNRKLARKLEKLRAKNLAVAEKNLGSSRRVNNQAEGASCALLQGNSEEPQTGNQTEHQTTYLTTTCDVDQKEHVASNKASDRDLTEGHSSLHARELQPSVSNGVIVVPGNSAPDISEDMKKPISDITICETQVAELASEKIDTLHQRSLKLQNDKYVATEGSFREELEKKPYSEFSMENSKECSHSGNNQMNKENASEDVEIDCLEKEDTLKDISVQLFSIEEQLDLIEPYNNPKCGGELDINFESEECASKTAGTENDELSSLGGEILVNNTPSKREIVATGTIGASGKLEKTSDLTTTNTRPLGSAAECLYNISVSNEMAYGDIPPLCFSDKETLTKSDDFDQIDGGSNDNYGPLECLDDADFELCTRYNGKKRTRESHEKSVPRPAYVKEDGDNFPDEFVNDGNDHTIDMTLIDKSFHYGNPSCVENGSLVANKPRPLIQKVSGRFTVSGLQPLLNSPGTGRLNSTFEETVPSEEETEDKGRGESDQLPLEETSSLEHLGSGTFEDETCSQDYAMSFKDLTKEMQEALVQRYAACTDVVGADKVKVEIVYEEVSRRSSDENSFSIVCEEASIHTCDDEKWMKQDVKEEIDDVSIKKPSSSKEALSDFVEQDEMKLKQDLVDEPPGCKIREVLSDHDNNESFRTSRGLKQDTPSHQGIYEDTDLPMATAISDVSRKPVVDSDEALNYSHSHQSGNADEVEKTSLDRNLHPVIDAPKEQDSSAVFNDALQSDYSGDKEDYSSASIASSFANNILEKTNDQKLFLGSENTDVHSRGEVSDFADCIKGTLAATKGQHKQRLLMYLDAMNEKTQQMMEENTQNDEDSFDEKAVCDTASETSGADVAVARAADESPVSEIQEVLREEHSKVEICETGDELDSWGSIDDMLSSDAHCVIVHKEESFFEAPYVSDVVNKRSNHRSEEEDKKTHEFETSPVSFLDSKMALRESHRDSLLSRRSVVGVRAKSTNDEICALEIETDTQLDSVSDLALPRVNGVKKGVFSAHQDISVSDNYDEILAVGEEFQGIEKVTKCKLNEDEFIDDFDQLLDEVEKDILIEESMSSLEINSHPSESKTPVGEIQDQSIVDVESVTWLTDIDNEELLLSSCDEEVAAINDTTLGVFSEDDEEPDSWGAMDELVDRRFQIHDSSFVLNGGESIESDDRRRANYERRIAAVVNISEHLLHQELLAAVKAAACEVTEIGALEDEVKQGVQKHHVHKDDINSPAKDKIQAYVTNKDEGVIFSGEKATVRDAIEQLNKLHSVVISIREQLSGRNGTKAQRYAVKTDIVSVPVLLNSISALHDNIGEMAEELKQATGKSDKGKVKSDEHLVAEMLEESRKEKAKMLVEITIMQEEVVAFKKMNDSLHAELEATKAELKCLQSRDEYKQRELTNLKNDFERKEKKWDGAEENLENALKDKLELLDEVEFLEDSLRFSTINNERLGNRVDELNETIKELKKRAEMDNKRHDYRHLREEVELLKGSLELSNQRETLLRCQVEGLKADVSNFKHCEQALKSTLKTAENEKSRIVEQLEKQLSIADYENARMTAELSRETDKENLLSELKKENMRVEDQINKLTKENSTLNAKLSKVSEKDNQMTELKSETTKVIKNLEDQLATLKEENDNLATELYKVSEKDNKMTDLKSEMSATIKHLEDQVANLKKENHNLATELCKLSEKDNEMIELKDKTSRFMNQLEDQLAALKKKNSTLSTELYKASEKDKEMSQFKNETSKFIEQLEDQLATLRKENSMLKAELYEASEKSNQMSEQKLELSKVINKLEDQLATLQNENSTLVTELPRASKSDNQMSELQSGTSSVIKQLEDQLAKLKKENSTLATDLSKVSEKDKQLAELCNQVENLTTQNKLLQDQALNAKKQFSGELRYLQEETKERGEGSMRSRRSRGSKSSDMKMLRKRIRQNEQELEIVGRFIRQRGLEFGRGPQYHIDPDRKDEPDKLQSAQDTFNHEHQHGKNSQDTSQVTEMKNIIEGIRKSLRQRENDLQKTKDALTRKTERTEFLERRVEETEMLLEEKNKLLRQNQCNLEKTDATLRQQLQRLATLENQLQEIENARNTAITSIMNKDLELEEAFRGICQKDERIDDLIYQLKQERLDKEYLKRAIEGTEENALKEKGLLQRLRELENQLQQTEELKETTLASLMDKQQELEQLYRSVSNKDAPIDNLTLELKQEKMKKQDMKRTISVTECNVNREKELLERLTQLERRVQETEMLLQEKNKLLRENQSNLEQTDTILRQQLQRSATLENQLQGMKNSRNTAMTSIMNKDQELDEAFRRICRKDQRIDDLIHQLKQERLDKECLKRAIEGTEENALREKGLLQRLRELENQLQQTEELRETTLASLMDKQQELEQLYRSISIKDAQIDDLTLELKQERMEKQDLKRVITVTECNVNRENGLLERSIQLEKRLQETQELKEKTPVSLKNNKEALEHAHNKIDELTQRLKREISNNECLRRAMEDTECNAKREKGFLEKRRAQFEIQLQEMERLQEKTESSLKIKETELQQVYAKLRRKDDTTDELKQELKQERSAKRKLRKTMERKNYNVQRQKKLLDSREEEVERLKEQLCDYEQEVEKLNVNLKQMRTKLEVAEDILTYRQDNVRNAGISSRIQYDHLQVFPTKQSRHTKENFRGIGSSMIQVAERLSELLQRQKEVDSSVALLKQKEAEAKRAVERLTEELNQRDDEMESLKSSLLKSVAEAECTRGRLREVEYENIDLKKNLADESDQVKKLEILVKQLEGGVQRAQNSLKDKETTLEETKERLQLKSSLLTSMEVKLCPRDNKIEEFWVANKERGFELERVQRSLKEVKKELEISSSIITKQNEEFVHLRTSVNRKSWEADKMKFGVEPTQEEVKLLSIQLECARKDKESLSRELAAATVRLEKEQILADRQKKALQEQVKSGLEDLKDKTKLIWDMKMSLRESTARISILEAEKLEQDECFRDHRRCFAVGVKQMKQCLNMANENEGLLQSGIGSAEHEMSELRKENQKPKFELLRKKTGEFPQDEIKDSCSGLFKVRPAFVVTCSFGVHI